MDNKEMDLKKHKEIMLKIANNLKNENVEAIKYYYSKIGDGVLEKIETPLKLIQILEQHGVIEAGNYGNFAKLLETIGRSDIVKDYFGSCDSKILEMNDFNYRRILNGGIFKFDLLENEICIFVEFKYSEDDHWTSVSNEIQSGAYYLTRKKNNKLFVKVENLICNNEKIYFRFSFHNSQEEMFYKDCTCYISGNYNYQFTYESITIASLEPIIFNSEFSNNIRKPDSLDWREINKIRLEKVPYDDQSSKYDEPIEIFAQSYMDRNFPATINKNDIICLKPSLDNKGYTTLIIDKFYHLFSENKAGICAILPGYHLRYHASLLKCNVENFRNCKYEDRIIMFYSYLNIIIITRIAHSLDDIKQESENCLNDIILFINVNSLFIRYKEFNIFGVVVLPSIDRRELKEELFFHFSDNWNSHSKSSGLEQILFLCKDDFEDHNLEQWWRLVAAYCLKKSSILCNNYIFFKQLIGLTMVVMAYVNNDNIPTLKVDPQEQIRSLILNNEQWNAVYDTSLKKIVTGAYGSGKSIVGKEIVKNCIQKVSENPLTLYYICCNHFSLYECEMKEFVDGIKKPSNVIVVCDNLFELWKNMSKKENIIEKNIYIPKLLEYLACTHKNLVYFVLDELSEDYFNKNDAVQFKNMCSTLLKESLVVFIPESISKNRKLVTNNKRRTLKKSCFQEEIIGMKVISLNKSMRVTESIKLLLDSAQETIRISKTVFNVPNTKNAHEVQNLKELPIENQQSSSSATDAFSFKFAVDSHKVYKLDQVSNKIANKNIDTTDFYDNDLDHGANIIAKSTENVGANSFMETKFAFKSCIIGHSIKGEKPKVIYFPFHDLEEKRSVKLLSVVLEMLFNKVRKTVVICNTMEEVQSVAYAIDIIGHYKAVTYSPHLQKYSPSLEYKVNVKKKLISDLDILVTDSKGFSGSESERVVVIVSPDEMYLRHVLVDAMSRSNSHLILLVLCQNNVNCLYKEGTIGSVLSNWSEEILENIIVILSDKEDQLCSRTECNLIINEHCEEFVDRGSEKDFSKYMEQFKIFHENNSIYERLIFNIQDDKVIKHERTTDLYALLQNQTNKSNFCKSLGSDWRMLGDHLSIPSYFLEPIEHDCKENEDKAHAMLDIYFILNKNEKNNTDKLKSALTQMNKLNLIDSITGSETSQIVGEKGKIRDNNKWIKKKPSSDLLNYKNFELSKVLNRVAYLIGKYWKSFGYQLGLTFQDLEQIDDDHSNTHEKALNVLLKWKQKDVNTSWQILKKELTLFERLDVINETEQYFAEQTTDLYALLQNQVNKSNFCKSLGSDWRVLGDHLSIPNYFLESIEQDCKENEDKAHAMLDIYFKLNKNEENYNEKLTSALTQMNKLSLIDSITGSEKSQIVGEKDKIRGADSNT